MLRVLVLLCSLALLLAPLGSAQAEPACAMQAVSQDMGALAQGADHQMPVPRHSAQGCDQLCAAVAILNPPEPAVAQVTAAQPLPRPVARLPGSQGPGPSERPPKRLL